MGHFTWAELIPFVRAFPHVFYSMLAGGVLLLLGFFAVRALKKSGGPAPDGAFGVKGFFEVLSSQICKLSDSVIGPKGRGSVPFFCFLFLYIWIQNLIGLLPGFAPPTDNLNTTTALGVFSFAVYNYLGFKEHGVSYLKQYTGPVLLLAPLFVIIEILSHAFRPLSLGLRLFGNMKGDHLVIGIFLDLAPVAAPVVFYFLGLFVCTLQAFIFTALSMVYISLSLSHDH